MNKTKMLYYDRIYVSEGININKANTSKDCDICLYWYFLDDGFKFQPNVFNGCHDVLMMSMNLSNIAIWNINSAYYHCIIAGISKSDAINMQNINLTEKSQALGKIKKLLSHIKMVKEIITFGDIEVEKHK